MRNGWSYLDFICSIDAKQIESSVIHGTLKPLGNSENSYRMILAHKTWAGRYKTIHENEVNDHCIV